MIHGNESETMQWFESGIRVGIMSQPKIGSEGSLYLDYSNYHSILS